MRIAIAAILVMLAVGCGETAADKIDRLAKVDHYASGTVIGSELGSGKFEPQWVEAVISTIGRQPKLMLTFRQWMPAGRRTVTFELERFEYSGEEVAWAFYDDRCTAECDAISECLSDTRGFAECRPYSGAGTDVILPAAATLSETNGSSIPNQAHGELVINSYSENKDGGYIIAGSMEMVFPMGHTYGGAEDISIAAEFEIDGRRE